MQLKNHFDFLPKKEKAMKTMVVISTRMILILLILMTIAGCFDESSNSNNLATNYVNKSNASGYVLVDTGQVLCFEYSDGHVTCSCSR